jgi:hypothetical protein
MDKGEAAPEDCGNGVEAVMGDGGSDGHDELQLDNKDNNGSGNNNTMAMKTVR